MVGLAACGFSVEAGNTPDPDAQPRSDSATVDQGSTIDAAIDAAISGCSADGVRVCVDATHSGYCQGGSMVQDRTCPPGSGCAAGYCTPPSGATPCMGDGSCSGGDVCVVYVASGVLTGFCTAPLGTTSGSCNAPGEDPTCDSGICVSGDETRCLSPCTTGNDCNNPNDSCVDVADPQTIEGASTSTLQYCVPD